MTSSQNVIIHKELGLYTCTVYDIFCSIFGRLHYLQATESDYIEAQYMAAA